MVLEVADIMELGEDGEVVGEEGFCCLTMAAQAGKDVQERHLESPWLACCC